jgi:hypothetical protein
MSDALGQETQSTMNDFKNLIKCIRMEDENRRNSERIDSITETEEESAISRQE